MSEIAMEKFEEIKLLELELVSPKTWQNLSRLSDLIADNFEEFGSSGRVISKQDLLETISPLHQPDYQLSDFTFFELAEDCVLVKYRSNLPGQEALRSSVWKKQFGGWQMLHHQATVAPKAT